MLVKRSPKAGSVTLSTVCDPKLVLETTLNTWFAPSTTAPAEKLTGWEKVIEVSEAAVMVASWALVRRTTPDASVALAMFPMLTEAAELVTEPAELETVTEYWFVAFAVVSAGVV